MAITKRKGKQGAVRYQVRVRDQDGIFYSARTYDRQVDAQNWERQLLNERDSGVSSSKKKSRNLLFKDFLSSWAKECRGNISGGWMMTQDQMIRDYILPFLADIRLKDIRPQHIGNVLGEMQAKGLGDQTRLHVYNLLHRMFQDSIHHFEFLNQNPVLKRYKPKVFVKERDCLTTIESKRLLEVSRGHFLGPAIWLMLLCGLRASEVQALNWDSIDFEKGRLHIRAAYKRKVRRIEPFPKQKSWGTAVMPEVLKECLQELKDLDRSDFVASGEKGRMLQYEVLMRGLKRLCKEAGVPEVSPHELRNSCTELYVERGASVEDLRRLLNQTTTSATMRYIHRGDERLSGLAADVSIGIDQPKIIQA